MIDHVSIGVVDLKISQPFYTGFLGQLGYSLLRENEAELAYGTENHWGFFLYPVSPGNVIAGSRSHVAFMAATRSAVESSFAKAAELGCKPIFAPMARPDISPTYYGAMFWDADGNKIEVVTNAPAEQ